MTQQPLPPVAPTVDQIMQQINQLPNAAQIKHLLYLKLGMEIQSVRDKTAAAAYPKTTGEEVHDFTSQGAH
jgi:hypothetical protein